MSTHQQTIRAAKQARKPILMELRESAEQYVGKLLHMHDCGYIALVDNDVDALKKMTPAVWADGPRNRRVTFRMKPNFNADFFLATFRNAIHAMSVAED